MVNIDDFIKRLETILDYYNLSASAFADKINVQRSSLSHLLSGRNKPSLDFIIKVIEVFPEVDLYWILNGRGVFPKQDKQLLKPAAVANTPQKQFPDLFSTASTNHQLTNKGIEKTSNSSNTTQKEIERIVIFYTDGSFKNYES